MKPTDVPDVLHAAVSDYVMPDKGREVIQLSNILILCGVTAAGKNTISRYLIEHNGFESVVSHTTRPPRQNHGVSEENGVDYWFVDDDTMLKLVEQRAFIEVKPVHGNTYYGTSIAAIQTAMHNKKRPVTEIDVQGAEEIARAAPRVRPLFILPPNYEVWMQRLYSRGTMGDTELRKRLASARQELMRAIDNPAFILVVNHEVAETAQEIMQLDSSAFIQNQRRSLAHQLLAALGKE